jgi:hypothetical protein
VSKSIKAASYETRRLLTPNIGCGPRGTETSPRIANKASDERTPATICPLHEALALPVMQRPRDRLRDQIRLERELTERVVAREATAADLAPSRRRRCAAGAPRPGHRCGDDSRPHRHTLAVTCEVTPYRFRAARWGWPGRGGPPYGARALAVRAHRSHRRHRSPGGHVPGNGAAVLDHWDNQGIHRIVDVIHCGDFARTRHRHRRGIALRSRCPST